MTPELDALWWLGPDIRTAARIARDLWPGVMSEDQYAVAVTEHLLDHELILDIEEMRPGGDRVWWLLAIARSIARTELLSHEDLKAGIHE